MDDMGYAVTPSAVINDYNRPPPTAPSRPTNNYNEFEDDGTGYNYGSYQGKKRKSKAPD